MILPAQGLGLVERAAFHFSLLSVFVLQLCDLSHVEFSQIMGVY